MVGWHHRLIGHGSEETRELVENRDTSRLQSMGPQRVGHDLATEQQQ